MSGQQQEDSFWVSYSDLATGLMIVFLVVMLIMMAIAKQQDELEQERVEELVQELQIILGTRQQLAEAVNRAFADNESISADPVTAQLTVAQDTVTFEKDNGSLDAKGKRFIEEFAPVYLCALWDQEDDTCSDKAEVKCRRIDPEDPERVRRILITGHADLEGDPRKNHYLSADRAEAVVHHVAEIMRCATGRDPLLKKISCPASLQFPAACDGKEQREALWRYSQERLYAVGAGEVAHCVQEAQRRPGLTCEALTMDERKEVSDATFRKVTFEVELTGSDMTGMLLDVLALEAEVSDAPPEPDSEIARLRDDVAEGCWANLQYHGCADFIEKCLIDGPTQAGFLCEGFYQHLEGTRQGVLEARLAASLERRQAAQATVDPKERAAAGKEALAMQLALGRLESVSQQVVSIARQRCVSAEAGPEPGMIPVGCRELP